MGPRYIGSKTQLVEVILDIVKELVPIKSTVSDLMCGTGAVSVELRKSGYKVIASDVMSQACHITKTRVMLQEPPLFKKASKYFIYKGQITLLPDSNYFSMINTLNNLPLIKDYFWREFSPDGKPLNGSAPRKYFSSENAQKIDAARLFLKKLQNEKILTELEESLMIHDIIMGTNDYANIAGTYGHYLSKFTSRALQSLKFTPTVFEKGGLLKGHKIINGYAEEIAPKISVELCYIDPPYMKRQYAANYHILETIAKGDKPKARGKSGLRPWRDQYSDFCSKIKIWAAFDKILSKMNAKHFLISYSSEGLVSTNDLLDFFKKYGEVSMNEIPYKRFKSRNEKAKKSIIEYLFHIEL